MISLALSSWRVLGFILLVGVEIFSDRDNRILNSTQTNIENVVNSLARSNGYSVMVSMARFDRY